MKKTDTYTEEKSTMNPSAMKSWSQKNSPPSINQALTHQNNPQYDSTQGKVTQTWTLGNYMPSSQDQKPQHHQQDPRTIVLGILKSQKEKVKSLTSDFQRRTTLDFDDNGMKNLLTSWEEPRMNYHHGEK
jgi:hypothetical protein